MLAGEVRPILTTNGKSGQHEYIAPFYVGSVHRGFVVARFSDPYEFFQGNFLIIAARYFIPSMLFALVLWFIWIRVSKAYLLRPYLSQLLALERNQAIGKMAAQVAHDIRSPLAALGALESELGALDEDIRLMVRSAVNRIKDIANNLLHQNRTVHHKEPVPGSKLVHHEIASIVLLPSLIEPLITEKRMQFRSRIGIEIDGNLDASSYGLFASVQPAEFKRVISNLVNNAVEALKDSGRVTLSLSSFGQKIELILRDNGRGIPPEILSKLGQRGETHGKEGGSGLGLYHARIAVESWNGTLSIDSKVGDGTSITLTLPKAASPEWFVSNLLIKPEATIVILDDDTSIHQIWQGRFDSLRVTEKGIEVVHLSTPEQLGKWINENPAASKMALFLSDYELGFEKNGLTLIEEFDLGPQSILVTSRFEEPQIAEGCRRLNVRLIPKGMAGYVPIRLEVPLEKIDAVLIDDDRLVHMSWNMVAQTKGIQLKSFADPGSFFLESDRYDRTVPIYIDSNLGSGVHGEDVALKAHGLGFTKIYLATGYQPEQFTQHTFLQGVLGKEPPF
jgi:signal transduction histidine kinase